MKQQVKPERYKLHIDIDIKVFYEHYCEASCNKVTVSGKNKEEAIAKLVDALRIYGDLNKLLMKLS